MRSSRMRTQLSLTLSPLPHAQVLHLSAQQAVPQFNMHLRAANVKGGNGPGALAAFDDRIKSSEAREFEL